MFDYSVSGELSNLLRKKHRKNTLLTMKAEPIDIVIFTVITAVILFVGWGFWKAHEDQQASIERSEQSIRNIKDLDVELKAILEP